MGNCSVSADGNTTFLQPLTHEHVLGFLVLNISKHERSSQHQSMEINVTIKNTQTHTHQREMLWSSYSDLCCLGDDSAVLLHRVGLSGGGPAQKTRVFEEGGERSLVLPVRLPPILPSFPRSLYFLLLHCCLLHGCALWVHCRGGGAEAANVAVCALHDASRQNAPRWRG